MYPNNELKVIFDGSKQQRIVEIEMTGNTKGDFKAANIKAGFSEFGSDAPDLNNVNYTWHHLDDFRYDAATGKSYCSVQLVRGNVHTQIKGMGHTGGSGQYKKFFGTGYGL